MPNNFNQLSKGNNAGSTPAYSFGEMTTAGAVTNKVIWPNGVYKIPDASGVTMYLKSTSANDTADGSGIRAVRVRYLDVNLNEKTVVKTLNGTADVSFDESIRFVQCMHLMSTGTNGGGAAGDITIYAGAQTYSMIATGDTRCTSSARMVPAGKVYKVQGVAASSVSGTSAAKAKIQVAATYIDGTDLTAYGTFIPFGAMGVQDGSEAHNLPTAATFPSGTVIGLLATVDKAATITGAWYGWEESVD